MAVELLPRHRTPLQAVPSDLLLRWAPGLVVTPRGYGLLLQPAVPTMQTFWVIALPIFMISSFFP